MTNLTTTFNTAETKATNEKAMQALKEFMFDGNNPESGKDYDFYTADRYIATFDEYITSRELEEVFSGFQAKTFVTKESFVCAYVVGKDVYVIYKADGLTLMHKEQIGSSLDNGAFVKVAPVTDKGFMIDRSQGYRKDEKARKVLRKMNMVLTSQYTA